MSNIWTDSPYFFWIISEISFKLPGPWQLEHKSMASQYILQLFLTCEFLTFLNDRYHTIFFFHISAAFQKHVYFLYIHWMKYSTVQCKFSICHLRAGHSPTWEKMHALFEDEWSIVILRGTVFAALSFSFIFCCQQDLEIKSRGEEFRSQL